MDKVDKYLDEKIITDGVVNGWPDYSEMRGTIKGLKGLIGDIGKMIEYGNLKGAKQSYQWLKKRIKDIEKWL